MKLSDFETIEKRGGRFVTQVQDVNGDETFELTIAGPERLVQEVFAEATIEITIDSSQTEEAIKRRYDELSSDLRKQSWSLAGLENLDELFIKEESSAPRPETSVFAAVRPISGDGTPFAISVSGFTVPAKASIFFFGSLVVFTIGAVLPMTGDQDLRLRLFSPTGPVVFSSINSGTSLDVALFTIPFPFVPVYEVVGFATGVCANFSAHGA